MNQFYAISVILVAIGAANCFGHGPRFIAQCVEESGATEEDIKKVIAHEIPDSEPAQCFMACMMKKNRMMNDDNSLNMNIVKRQMGPLKVMQKDLYDNIIAIFEECNNSQDLVDDDQCISAKNIAECVIPKIQELSE